MYIHAQMDIYELTAHFTRMSMKGLVDRKLASAPKSCLSAKLLIEEATICAGALRSFKTTPLDVVRDSKLLSTID